MAHRKHETADLRRRYTLNVELGLVLALLLLIGAVHLDWRPGARYAGGDARADEVIAFEEILPTQHLLPLPAPPRPPIPVSVPDDELLEDEGLDLDAGLDLTRALALLPPEPPPPPPPPPPSPGAGTDDYGLFSEAFVIVEDGPALVGGLEGLQSRIQYPAEARTAGIHGRVIVQFVVDEFGTVLDPVIVRGVSERLDEEALRVVRTARFHPPRDHGRLARVKMSLPITFRLD